jgi:hypothetical protein
MVTRSSKPATKSAVSQAKISVEKSVPVQSPSSQVAQATRPAAKPLSGTIAKLKPKPKTEKPVKVKKPKLIRDKFKIPKVEYTVLEDLKDRATKLGCPAKKSELLRAGVKALAALPDGAFCSALSVLPTVKVDGPKKDKTQ